MDDLHTPVPPPPEPPAAPVARVRRSRWVGIVWAVPLAALLIVGFLGLRALTNRGIDVVVTFDSAAGAKPDDTKVIYQGVEAGTVTKIELNPDGRRVDMTVRMDPRSEPGLTTTTKFWLIGASPTFNDLSSVKAAVAGVAIGVAPGTGGTPTRRFSGFNEPPIVLPGTPGRAYVLTSDVLGTARVGSSLYFRGQEVGKITATRFASPGSFQLDIFIFAPYDLLIRPDTLFWVSSPVRVSLTDTGASASLEHAGALINGAVEVDHLGDDSAAPSPAGAPFVLYQSRSEAEAGPVGPEVPYAFSFRGPGGELNPGSPVRLLGFQIGEVKTVRMVVDERTGGVSTAVVAMLYPRRLQVAMPAAAAASGPPGAAEAAWREPTDAAVTRLLALGHRAQLVQKPPVIGGRIITLDRVVGAGPATLGPGTPRSVPTIEAAGGLDAITGQVSQLLVKFNALPIEAIGRDVQILTGRLSQLASSSQLTDSLQRLNGTLAQAEKMLADVQPQVGPLLDKVNRAADEAATTVAAARGVIAGGGSGLGGSSDASLPAALQELTDAARSIRSLADYLGRHPESLIRGRGSEPSGNDARKESR